MLVFPQLLTGAVTTYPLTKQVAIRNISNVLGDGGRVVYTDSDLTESVWNLEIHGMTGVEWVALQALFESVRGRWQRFTFLDPVGNLLAESETFGATAWTNGPLLQLTAGVLDPLGTNRATQVVNAGQANEGLTQMIYAPGTFHYCVSLWCRAQNSTSIRLSASTAGAGASEDYVVTQQWKRIFLPVSLAAATEQITFGVDLPVGESVDLFGMQVDAQLAPGGYRRTGESSGVYQTARFDTDDLTVRAQSQDCYDTVVRIVVTES